MKLYDAGNNEVIYFDKRAKCMFIFEQNMCRVDRVFSVETVITAPEIKGLKKAELEKRFIDFCLAQCADWTVDELPVQICKSAAGYYAGCIDPYEGPYCRISGYGDDRMIVAHWMLMHHHLM